MESRRSTTHDPLDRHLAARQAAPVRPLAQPSHHTEGLSMGLIFRKRIRLTENVWLNVSRSGISLSVRKGRVTVNSRGSLWVRIARGLTHRS